jgi:short-subunit dehydrogenase
MTASRRLLWSERIERAWARRRVQVRPEDSPEEQRPGMVLITGASRGIGYSLAHEFAAAGHDLMLVARGREGLEEASARIGEQHGVTVHLAPIDLAEADACGRLAAMIEEMGLRVDVLVNNAAIGLSGSFAEHPHDNVARLVDLNVRALSELTRIYLPGMLARGEGGIMNIASLGGAVPGPYQAAYYASKAYVISLSEAIAHEISGLGVRLSVVVPGPVNTHFHNDMGAGTALYARLLMRMSPQAVARAAYSGFRCRKRLITPGVLTTFNYFALRVLPHTLLVPLMGVLLKRR